MPKKLRVLPRLKPTSEHEAPPRVADPHGSDSQPMIRRIIGQKHVQVAPGRWAFVATGEVEELDYHHDLAKAIRDGDLWAADEETALAVGVKFDGGFDSEDFAEAKEKFQEITAPKAPEPAPQSPAPGMHAPRSALVEVPAALDTTESPRSRPADNLHSAPGDEPGGKAFDR